MLLFLVIVVPMTITGIPRSCVRCSSDFDKNSYVYDISRKKKNNNNLPVPSSTPPPGLSAYYTVTNKIQNARCRSYTDTRMHICVKRDFENNILIRRKKSSGCRVDDVYQKITRAARLPRRRRHFRFPTTICAFFCFFFPL